MKWHVRLTPEGRVPQPQIGMIQAELKRLAGKAVTFEVKGERRSLNQNSFFHGPFVTAALEMFLDKGNDFDEAMTKEIIKDLFGPKVTVHMPDGRMETKSKSSADWTKAEAEDVMEKTRAWASGYGYALPFPNEHMTPPIEAYDN